MYLTECCDELQYSRLSNTEDDGDVRLYACFLSDKM